MCCVVAQIVGRCFQFLENREDSITRIKATVAFSRYYLPVVKKRGGETSEIELPEKGPILINPAQTALEELHKKQKIVKFLKNAKKWKTRNENSNLFRQH